MGHVTRTAIGSTRLRRSPLWPFVVLGAADALDQLLVALIGESAHDE